MKKFAFLFFIVICYFLPYGLSKFGKRAIEIKLNQQLSGNVTIEKVSLNWIKPQEFNSIRWIDPSSQVEFYVETIHCKADLFSFFFGKNLPFHLEDGKISWLQPKGLQSILKKKLLSKKGLHLHFTSLQGSIEKEKICLDPTEFYLRESLGFQLFGTVDFAEDALHMSLKIPARTMKKLFKMKDLPPGYILEIPLEGKLENFSLDTLLLNLFLGHGHGQRQGHEI